MSTDDSGRPGLARARGLLTAAIVAEVLGTLALRQSEGFTRPLPALATLAGYAASMWVFARALDDGRLTMGVAYATLSGTGLAAATAATTWLFGEHLTATQLVGLVLLGAGVLTLQAAPTAPTPAVVRGPAR